ncbi:hypothetical protein [Candidatus Poriferisodalis sp.]|uniref:hypothetical protein n=1 Tax=Candidatus Poriferisodalis sp. TaxID=3101277 RepID=UPI003B013C5A
MAVNVCDYSPSEAAKATEDIDANYPYNNPMGKLGRVGAHFRNALRGTSSSWPVHDLSLDESMRRPIYDFVDNLSWFSREVGDSGYGNIAWIGHVGGPPGDRRDTYHNTGHALDIVHIQWAGGNTSYPKDGTSEVHDDQGNWLQSAHRRLVAVEAALRKHFGYVLNRYIGDPKKNTEGPNSPHQNHFHVDNGCERSLRVDRTHLRNPLLRRRPVRSCHYFVQDCINAFTDLEVEYDGRWGNATEHGYMTLMSDLGMECLDPTVYLTHYMLFLDYIIVHGLSDNGAGTYRWGDHIL